MADSKKANLDAACKAVLMKLYESPPTGDPLASYTSVFAAVSTLETEYAVDAKEKEAQTLKRDTVLKCIKAAVDIACQRTGKEEMGDAQTSRLRAAVTRVARELWTHLRPSRELVKELAENHTEADPRVSALRNLSIMPALSAGATTATLGEKKQWTSERELHELVVALTPLVSDTLESMYSHDPSVDRPHGYKMQPVPYATFIGESKLAERCLNVLKLAQKRKNVASLAAFFDVLAEFVGDRAKGSPFEVTSKLFAMADPPLTKDYILSLRALGDPRPRDKKGRAADGSEGRVMAPLKEEEPVVAARTAGSGKDAKSPAVASKQPESRLGSFGKSLLYSSVKLAVKAFKGSDFAGRKYVKISDTRMVRGHVSRFTTVALSTDARATFQAVLQLAEKSLNVFAFDAAVKAEVRERLRAMQKDLADAAVVTLDPDNETQLKGLIDEAWRVVEERPAKPTTDTAALVRANPAASASTSVAAAAAVAGGGKRSATGAGGPQGGVALDETESGVTDVKTLPKGLANAVTSWRSLEEAVAALPAPASADDAWTAVTKKKKDRQERNQQFARIIQERNDEVSGKTSEASKPARVRTKKQPRAAPTGKPQEKVFTSGMMLVYSSEFGGIRSAPVFLMPKLAYETRELIKIMQRWSLSVSSTGEIRQYWRRQVPPMGDYRETDNAGTRLHASKRDKAEEVNRFVQLRADIYQLSAMRSLGQDATARLGYKAPYWEADRVGALYKWICSLGHQLEAANMRRKPSPNAPVEWLYHPMPVFRYARQANVDGKVVEELGDSWRVPPVARLRDAEGKLVHSLKDPNCTRWRHKIANLIFYLRSLLGVFLAVSQNVTKAQLKGTEYEVINVLLAFFNPDEQTTMHSPASQARAAIWSDVKEWSKVAIRVGESAKALAKASRLGYLEARLATHNNIVDLLVQYWLASDNLRTTLGATQSYKVLTDCFVEPWLRRYTLAFARRYGLRDKIKADSKEEDDRALFMLPQYIAIPAVPLRSELDPVRCARVAFMRSRDFSLFTHLEAIEGIVEHSSCALSLVHATARQIQMVRYRCAANVIAAEWFSGAAFVDNWDTLVNCDEGLKADAKEAMISMSRVLATRLKDARGSGLSHLPRSDLRDVLSGLSECTTDVVSIRLRTLYNRFAELLSRLLSFASAGEPVVMIDVADHIVATFDAFLEKVASAAVLTPLHEEVKQLSQKFKVKSGVSEKEASLFHKSLWEGDFHACYHWCRRNLADGPNFLPLQNLLYAASGHHHQLVRVNGVPAIKESAVAYASGAGADLVALVHNVAMQTRAFSSRVQL